MIRLIVICLLLSGCAHDHLMYRHHGYYDAWHPSYQYPRQYEHHHHH